MSKPPSPKVAVGAPDEWVDANLDDLVALYRHLHAHPELSFHERETSARLAQEWRAAGAEVTTGIGGYGVVGMMRNGAGPTLMLRTDMDALPITEETGVPYASQVVTATAEGVETGVMHACGHDVHMTNLVGVAKYLGQNQASWSGTVMLIGQPAEECGAGARAMLKDGLFERFTKPDYGVALHIAADLPAGQVACWSGYATANVDSVDITIRGRGGHGSRPASTIDPIVQAAELVLALQTIVSRELNPSETAVITVGSIHGGTKHNIIDDECQLQLTVRSYTDEVRQHLRNAIVRRSNAVAAGAGAPAPDVRFTEGTPSLYVDERLSARVMTVLRRVLGEEQVELARPVLAGEDYGQYGRAGVPVLMYRLGTISPPQLREAQAAGRPLPSLHSPIYCPDVEPTLRAGVTSMASIALDLLQ